MEILEIDKWNRDRGDSTLRLNYELNENSIVFDLGGYKGEWAQKIYDKYGCNVYVFEPVNSFYNTIVDKFQKNEKIKIYNFGLSNNNSEETISIEGDSSSIFSSSGNIENILLKSFSEFIKETEIKNIDLMKINIEGGEFDLLDHLIKEDFIKSIKNIQVQFHRFIDDYDRRRDIIREELTKTHKETYCYEFIWENWKRIS